MNPLSKRARARRQLPPTRYPLAAEMAYSKALRQAFTRWWNQTLKALSKALGQPLGRARLDAASDEVFAAARAMWGQIANEFEPEIRKASDAVNRTSSLSLQRQMKAAKLAKANGVDYTKVLTVDVFKAEPQVAQAVEAWTAENVRLIRNIGDVAANRLEARVTEVVRSGVQTRSLARELEEEYGFSRNRAKLIARDQIGKLNGRINQTRQQAAGCESYTWHTMQDGRVRKEHGLRNGVVYRWDSPPADGHPGHPVQCRCTPTPVFAPEAFGLTPEEADEDRREQEARNARRRAQVESRQARTKEVQAQIKERQKQAREQEKANAGKDPKPLTKPKGPHRSTVGSLPNGYAIPAAPAAAPAVPLSARTNPTKAELEEARRLSPSYPPTRQTPRTPPRQPRQPNVSRTPPKAPAPVKPLPKLPEEPLAQFSVNLNEVNWSAEEKARIQAQREQAKAAAKAAQADPTPLNSFRLKPKPEAPAAPVVAPLTGSPVVGEIYNHTLFGPSTVVRTKGQQAVILTATGRKIWTNINLLGFQ